MVRTHRGKNAIVTGAASGIGKATARALADAGAEVIGLDLNSSNGDVEILACDVACETDVIRTVADIARRFGQIDVLVNSAGLQIDSGLAGLSLSELDRMYAVNVHGTVLVTRECLPHFRDGARVVNIASDLAYLGRAGSSGYAATKGAIVALTRSWARELAPRILVNAVAPGPTDTPLLNFAALPRHVQALELSNPLARIGRPEEIAQAILFLASDGASFMTGQCVGVDGGAAMH
jgi:3-oxoacyl-[acyl-carrier protein] reductase